MRTVHLTVDLMVPQHPDYPLIWDWLTKVGCDPAWVKIPSDVKVLKDAAVTTEYLHTADGELYWETPSNGTRAQPKVAPVRYEFLPSTPPLPEMSEGRVTHDD